MAGWAWAAVAVAVAVCGSAAGAWSWGPRLWMAAAGVRRVGRRLAGWVPGWGRTGGAAVGVWDCERVCDLGGAAELGGDGADGSGRVAADLLTDVCVGFIWFGTWAWARPAFACWAFGFFGFFGSLGWRTENNSFISVLKKPEPNFISVLSVRLVRFRFSVISVRFLGSGYFCPGLTSRTVRERLPQVVRVWHFHFTFRVASRNWDGSSTSSQAAHRPFSQCVGVFWFDPAKI